MSTLEVRNKKPEISTAGLLFGAIILGFAVEAIKVFKAKAETLNDPIVETTEDVEIVDLSRLTIEELKLEITKAIETENANVLKHLQNEFINRLTK